MKIVRALFFIAGLLPSSVCAQGLLHTHREQSRVFRYEAPSQESLDNARRLFALLLNDGSSLDAIARLCATEELDLIVVQSPGDEFLVLKEMASRRTGRGFYAFRRNQATRIAFQAPHAFSDLRTGRIVERLFLESRAVAAAWNTVKRGEQKKGADRGGVDFSRQPDSYYQMFTAAFGATHPRGAIVQVHGFAKENRNSLEGYLSDVIISSGTREPERVVQRLGRCLRNQEQDRISIYPMDVRELGGTSNLQGSLLRGIGFKHFVHLELSGHIRKRLVQDASYRRTLLVCLGATER